MIGVARARLAWAAVFGFALPMALVLTGCGGERAADALFPLDADHRWVYRVVTQWSDGTSEQDALTLTTLGEEPLTAAGPSKSFASGPAWRRHGDDGVDHWLRVDADGIRRVATRALFDTSPHADAPQRYVLKAPYEVGTGWDATTTAYLLSRKFDFPREVRHTHAPVPMSYRIEADRETVDTPAGRYTPCLRVRGTASIRVYADPVGGWRDVPLTTLEWYCRGVGLARLERTEPSPSPFMLGGVRTLELESFK